MKWRSRGWVDLRGTIAHGQFEAESILQWSQDKHETTWNHCEEVLHSGDRVLVKVEVETDDDGNIIAVR